MANTYTLIASSIVGSGGASTIDFTSIPSTYTDLMVVLSARSTRNLYEWDDIRQNINSSGVSTSITAVNVYGTGSATGSNTGVGTAAGIANTDNVTANSFSSVSIYYPNYTSSNNKSISVDAVSENNATSALAILTATLWSNTAAITSLSFSCANGNFKQYSTAYLYGISNS